jgi:hypothetical protein
MQWSVTWRHCRVSASCVPFLRLFRTAFQHVFGKDASLTLLLGSIHHSLVVNRHVERAQQKREPRKRLVTRPSPLAHRPYDRALHYDQVKLKACRLPNPISTGASKALRSMPWSVTSRHCRVPASCVPFLRLFRTAFQHVFGKDASLALLLGSIHHSLVVNRRVERAQQKREPRKRLVTRPSPLAHRPYDRALHYDRVKLKACRLPFEVCATARSNTLGFLENITSTTDSHQFESRSPSRV